MTTKKELTEFKHQETRAAFLLMNTLRKKLEKGKTSADLLQIDIAKKKSENSFKTIEHEAQQEMFLISFLLEIQLVQDNIDKLQEDIENQTFDF